MHRVKGFLEPEFSGFSHRRWCMVAFSSLFISSLKKGTRMPFILKEQSFLLSCERWFERFARAYKRQWLLSFPESLKCFLHIMQISFYTRLFPFWRILPVVYAYSNTNLFHFSLYDMLDTLLFWIIEYQYLFFPF